ncbi:hypothetical protein J7E96_19640 [Streptomyces sp. ISL-96]|uniref:hypothetical protein n=1 Tax=Streptomyces sp. ISL-96 TaxID=2819191 RepID=UPI001BE53A10|nr:hypothetical protein [Streptomyces sp. ISL-96]MBT2490688.1 hypothetical protein [Streptomyces sp. ISL-96]
MKSVSGESRTASSGASRVRVIVGLDVDRFEEAAQAARRAGMIIESEQPEIGTAVGTVARDALAALAAADGVEDVERERVYQLPDPDAPVQ